jgi:hypothetical protein
MSHIPYQEYEVEDFIKSVVEENVAYMVPNSKITPVTGGPSSYYDMPFSEWVTTNDMMEYLAEHKWGKYGIHLKDVFKGLCRWGDKEGTDTLYDTKKMIYYGCRVLRMMVGKQGLRDYLNEILNDKQFK